MIEVAFSKLILNETFEGFIFLRANSYKLKCSRVPFAGLVQKGAQIHILYIHL